MAAVIHHGGGVGTYKTFAVLQRHAIPELQAGRTVISTVRGFDSIRVIEAVMNIEIPESAEIIFVDLETTEGIEKIRRWWEWAPIGAYIIIDEAQLIYPKGRRVGTYDYPAKNGLSSEESAENDKRPNGFLQAFTMQRHYNWDLAIITPNIKMLLPEIQQVTQVAYEHKYMGGLLPWAKHGWREKQHSPLESGSATAHPAVRYKADKRIYQVYQSTKTGSHSATNGERSVFQNPKIISILLFSFSAVVLFIYLFFFKILAKGNGDIPVENPRVNVQVSSAANPVHGVDSNNIQVNSVQPVVVPIETTKFGSSVMSIVGKMFDEFVIEIGMPPTSYQMTTKQLFENNVKIKIVNDCLIVLTHIDIEYNVRCPMHNRNFENQERSVRTPIKLEPFGALTGT